MVLDFSVGCWWVAGEESVMVSFLLFCTSAVLWTRDGRYFAWFLGASLFQ